LSRPLPHPKADIRTNRRDGTFAPISLKKAALLAM
jgi:hypothetical protein